MQSEEEFPCSPGKRRRSSVKPPIGQSRSSMLFAILLLTGVVTSASLAESPTQAAPDGGTADPDRAATSFLDAFRRGKPALDLRYRYENVDQDSFEKDARASTLRTALGFRTLEWKGLSLFVEAENVATLGNDLYDDGGCRGSVEWGHGPARGRRPGAHRDQPGPCRLPALEVEGPTGADRVQCRRSALRGQRRLATEPPVVRCPLVRERILRRANFFYGHLDKVHRVNGATWDTSSHLFNLEASTWATSS